MDVISIIKIEHLRAVGFRVTFGRDWKPDASRLIWYRTSCPLDEVYRKWIEQCGWDV